MNKRQFKKELKKIGRYNSGFYSRGYYRVKPRKRKKMLSWLKRKNHIEFIARMKEFSRPLRFGYQLHDDAFAMIKTVAV